MSTYPNERTDDSADERESSFPALRGWWNQLSGAAKVLIPTSAAVFLLVAASALPPLV
jgi:hypothetical protein